jgi:hypothetical protein
MCYSNLIDKNSGENEIIVQWFTHSRHLLIPISSEIKSTSTPFDEILFNVFRTQLNSDHKFCAGWRWESDSVWFTVLYLLCVPKNRCSGIWSTILPATEQQIALSYSQQFCLSFSWTNNPFRVWMPQYSSHSAIVPSTRIAFNRPIDGQHHDGNESRLRPDGDALRTVALFIIDSTLSHPPHLFNGTYVRIMSEPTKIGAEHGDTDCIECFFSLLRSRRSDSINLENTFHCD